MLGQFSWCWRALVNSAKVWEGLRLISFTRVFIAQFFFFLAAAVGRRIGG